MVTHSALILEELAPFYQPQEFPVLLHQYKAWSESRPLEGMSIIDASPLFRNTCAKYAALLAAGAKVTVALSPIMPHDPDILPLLERYGISFLDARDLDGSYDVVMDCAGALSNLESRYGYVELTRSGARHYEDCTQPVWMVDAGKIKQIETCLGTGESFFRAMKALGHEHWEGKTLLVAGYGKVGRGIVLHALHHHAEVMITDVEEKVLPHPSVRFIHAQDRPALSDALCRSFCAVTATGRQYGMEALFDADQVISSPVLLANMGVENEWGLSIPEERILNGGSPLNFMLADPTLMCYIDPPLALHNQGAVELVQGRVANGISTPSVQIEQGYLDIIRENGSIPPQLLNSIF